MSHYIFDNAAPQASQRFASLEMLYDPWTIRHLETTGIGPGWQCWEIGAGGGSIARWLADRCGPSGHVLVTDIDPRFLVEAAALIHPQIEIQRQDIGNDPLPVQSFDLIHARLVLIHVPTREQALARMVRALSPGGWLIVEDFDFDSDRLPRSTLQVSDDRYGCGGSLSEIGRDPGSAHGRTQWRTSIDLGPELVSAPAGAWSGQRQHGGLSGSAGG